MAADTKNFHSAVTAEIVAWCQANATGTDVVYENGPVVGEAEISSPWVDVEFRYYGAAESSIGSAVNRPAGRHSGAIALGIYTREGEGTGKADAIAESLIQTLASRRLASGVLRFPQRLSPSNVKGWHRVGVLIPFHVDVR